MTVVELMKQIAKGKGSFIITNTKNPGTVTAASAASGFQTVSFSANDIVTVFPNLIQSCENNLNSNINVGSLTTSTGTGKSSYLARIYKVGTASLTTLGSALSHVAPNPFPLIFNEMGTANNLPLIPIIQVTTALSGTASAFTFTYTNQNNLTVSSDKTFTFPSATTAINTCFFLPLNVSDYGALDINSITLTTTSTTGTVTIWMLEIVNLTYSYLQVGVPVDNLAGLGLFLKNKNLPTTQNNNAVEQYLITLNTGTTGAVNNIVEIGVQP